jgi:hypothetical protein
MTVHDEEKLAGLVSGSSILQIAVENALQSQRDPIGGDNPAWRVVQRSAFRDDRAGAEFVNQLVLARANVRFVIECLNPVSDLAILVGADETTVHNIRCRWALRSGSGDSRTGTHETTVLPALPQSAFVSGRGRELVELSAARLVTAIDALSSEELRIAEHGGSVLTARYVPVIVTTALSVYRIDPDKVSFESSVATEAMDESTDALWFRKVLEASSIEDSTIRQLREAISARERSVLVLTAAHVSLLARFDLGDPFPP